MFRTTVFKTLGRVGSVFLRIIKTPTKKSGIFVKKVYGRPVPIGRVGNTGLFRPNVAPPYYTIL